MITASSCFVSETLVCYQVTTYVEERGQKPRITVDAFPGQTYTGVVTEVASLPDRTSNNGSSSNGIVYPAKIKLDDSPKQLRPGMSARVEIPIIDRDNVVTVLVQAVLLYDGKDHVAVKKPDGGFEYREVILGDTNNTEYEVKQGLEPGDRVALEPSELMREQEKRAKRIGEPTQPAAGKSDAPQRKAPR
jgi:HlyD family secretion protein